MNVLGVGVSAISMADALSTISRWSAPPTVCAWSNAGTATTNIDAMMTTKAERGMRDWRIVCVRGWSIES